MGKPLQVSRAFHEIKQPERTKERRAKALCSLAMHETPPLVRVSRIPVLYDYWGRPFKRPFSSDILRQALQRSLARPDGPLISSLAQWLGKPIGQKELLTVSARLFQEGNYAWVFRVTVQTLDRQKHRFALIVAKNGAGLSRVAQQEHHHLKRLYARLPEAVVKPLAGGFLQTPTTRPVRIYAYAAQWLSDFHELGVQADNMNFYINEEPFFFFDAPATETIKARMLRTLFCLYDPERREAAEPPRVGAGDFVITRRAPHEIRLIACRKILSGVTLDRCIRLYLGYQGLWGDRIFHFLPKDAGLLRQALMEGLVMHHGLGQEEVFASVRRFRKGLAGAKSSQRGWSPSGTLDRLLASSSPRKEKARA